LNFTPDYDSQVAIAEFDEGYSDDPIEDSPVRRGKNRLGPAIAILIVMSFAFKGVYAANVTLGGSGKSEFGQGIQITTSCSGSNPISVKPQISFSNSSGSGTFLLSGFAVSGVPTECNGKLLSFSFYSETGTSSLAVVDSSTSNVDIKMVSNSFSNSQSGITLTGISSSGFTATFNSPFAQASQVSRVTIQSGVPAALANLGSIDIPLADGLSFTPIAAFSTGAFTVDTWIKFTSAPTGNSLIISGSSAFGLWVNSARTNFYIALWGPGSGMQTFTVPALSLNTWYHIAVVRDASRNMQFFVNGSRNGNASVTDNNNYSSGASSMLAAGAGGDVAVRLSYFRVSTTAIFDPLASSITAPAAPSTVGGGTIMLLKGDTNGYLYDSAQPSRTFTVTGGVTSSSDNPFN